MDLAGAIPKNSPRPFFPGGPGLTELSLFLACALAHCPLPTTEQKPHHACSPLPYLERQNIILQLLAVKKSPKSPLQKQQPRTARPTISSLAIGNRSLSSSSLPPTHLLCQVPAYSISRRHRIQPSSPFLKQHKTIHVSPSTVSIHYRQLCLNGPSRRSLLLSRPPLI
jgi:hypothetical protein